MNQEEVAALASTTEMPISQAMISALETRDSETTIALFALARAVRINPEWLQTGEPQNDSGLETDAWKPPSPDLSKDEASLLKDYGKASDAWKLTLRLMARTPPEDQPELSKNMNILMTTIFGQAVPDDRLGDNWRRPDQPKEPKK